MWNKNVASLLQQQTTFTVALHVLAGDAKWTCIEEDGLAVWKTSLQKSGNEDKISRPSRKVSVFPVIWGFGSGFPYARFAI